MTTPEGRVPGPPEVPSKNADWETLVGGNLLNKLGVFIVVIGLALALGYSFTHIGRPGRVAVSTALSVAMLASGFVLELRERYRTFARGLIGGGWAALYFTVYAMQAIDAAKVVYNPWTGGLLLLAVAAGMIAHSLRYGSETVTGLAYFIAFVTLAITEVTALSAIALLPLAGSLLFVAYRFRWRTFAVFGLAATYATCALRGDTGAPLWQAQMIFAVYWVLFEAFDIVLPHRALLPLNAFGALGLSLLKWQDAEPGRIWILAAGAALAYLASTVARWRSGRWQESAALTAALAAAAVFLKLDHHWIGPALLIEAELFHLAGVRLRSAYLRSLAGLLFGVQVAHMIVADVAVRPAREWTPLASMTAAVFYGNRALCAAHRIYGFAAAGLLAMVAGFEAPAAYVGRVWLAIASASFAIGWWRRLWDFRAQGYVLAAAGALWTALYAPHPPLSIAAGAAAGMAAVLCARFSEDRRFFATERFALRFCGAAAATGMLAGLIARLAPERYVGVAWMALGLPLLELGLRQIAPEFRRLSYSLVALGAGVVVALNIAALHNSGPWPERLVPLGAAIASFALGARARDEEGGRVRVIASCAATGFLLTALWAVLPATVVAPAWAGLALLFAALTRRGLRNLSWHSAAVAAFAFLRACAVNLDSTGSVATCAAVIACLYAAQFLAAGAVRTWYSLLATLLTSSLLYFEVSGSLLTIAWGVQGLVMLGAGFPSRDRILRLSGLALLCACILKLFVWDLRHLDTLPRIVSFLVLGLILVGVSWIYTQFRDQVSKHL